MAEEEKRLTELKGVSDTKGEESDEGYLLSSTPYALPDSPTRAGYTAQTIKKYNFRGYQILFRWLKRAIEETNAFCDASDKENAEIKKTSLERLNHLEEEIGAKKSELDRKDTSLESKYQELESLVRRVDYWVHKELLEKISANTEAIKEETARSKRADNAQLKMEWTEDLSTGDVGLEFTDGDISTEDLNESNISNQGGNK